LPRFNVLAGGPGSFIEEIGCTHVKRGQTIGAAYVVGWFDSIPEMQKVYDKYKGKRALIVEGGKYRLE
jgi:hypothetical protein